MPSWKSRTVMYIATCVVLVPGGPAAAHDLAPDDYGTDDVNIHFVSGEEFVCGTAVSGTCEWTRGADGFWQNTGTGTWSVWAPVRLPTGALITGLVILGHDGTWVTDLEVDLYRTWVTALGASGETALMPTWSTTGEPQHFASYVDVDPDVTVAYRTGQLNPTYQSYTLAVLMPDHFNIFLRGIMVYWYRQISPAPTSATFLDVGTGHWAFRHVEALADSGITAGCGGGNFCPDDPLTRAQMAVFLAKALGLHWSP